MRNKILTGLILLIVGTAQAASDRFGNERDEIPRSSYTASNEKGVTIASAPVAFVSGSTVASGGLVLRYVSCSGVNASTLTFVDAMVYNLNPSTRVVFAYQPVSPSAILGTPPAQVNYNAFFSSAITYQKEGFAPCVSGWDYTTRPRHGDPRN